uniref:Uncharacterized protein n=1 Tax=Parascaris univalens TaxID=6257 RepID=A0A915A3Q7_PARUN
MGQSVILEKAGLATNHSTCSIRVEITGSRKFEVRIACIPWGNRQ